jgi:hypothetical protein
MGKASLGTSHTNIYPVTLFLLHYAYSNGLITLVNKSNVKGVIESETVYVVHAMEEVKIFSAV